MGKKDAQIFFVGNTMIDTLVHFKSEIEASTILEEIQAEKQDYFLVTMHRPRNVDAKQALLKIIDLFENTTKIKKVVFSIHPRTLDSFNKFGLFEQLNTIENLTIIEKRLTGWQLESFKESYNHKIENGISFYKKNTMD